MGVLGQLHLLPSLATTQCLGPVAARVRSVHAPSALIRQIWLRRLRRFCNLTMNNRQ